MGLARSLILFVLSGIVWVFLLSIEIYHRPLFSYAHSIVVDNKVVEFIDDTIHSYWGEVKRIARRAVVDDGSERHETI